VAAGDTTVESTPSKGKILIFPLLKIVRLSLSGEGIRFKKKNWKEEKQYMKVFLII
jgi:hypothetical protein